MNEWINESVNLWEGNKQICTNKGKKEQINNTKLENIEDSFSYMRARSTSESTGKLLKIPCQGFTPN